MNVTAPHIPASRAAAAPGLGHVAFDPAELDRSIHESSLDLEFDLDPALQRRLAATAMVICSVALIAESDAEFEIRVAELDLPDEAEGLAYMLGFAEHVKQDLVTAFEPAAHVLPIRDVLSARLARARALLGA
jgi:hypothetical protein